MQFFKTVRVVIGADVSHDNHESVFHGGLQRTHRICPSCGSNCMSSYCQISVHLQPLSSWHQVLSSHLSVRKSAARPWWEHRTCLLSSEFVSGKVVNLHKSSQLDWSTGTVYWHHVDTMPIGYVRVIGQEFWMNVPAIWLDTDNICSNAAHLECYWIWTVCARGESCCSIHVSASPHLFVDVIVMAVHIVDWPVVCIELCNLPGTIKGKVVVLILLHFDKTSSAWFLGSATDILLLQVWKSLTLMILYILSGFSKWQTPWLLHWGQHDETCWHWVCKYSRRQSLDEASSSVPERNSCRSLCNPCSIP